MTEVLGSPALQTAPRAEWRFTDAPDDDALLGWTADGGVTDLHITDGKLTGVTTSDRPILHVEWDDPGCPDDQLRSMEIELRTTVGANLEVELRDAEDTLENLHTENWSLSLSAYGYARKTTPVLTRLASEGSLFRDAIAQAAWTKVSTPSILTSLYPASHTVRDTPDRLPSSATTLAEVFRAAGYATLSFSSVTFTGQSSNLHQGFEVVHEGASRTGDKRGQVRPVPLLRVSGVDPGTSAL